MNRTDPFGRPLPTPEEEEAFDATRAAFEAAYRAEAEAEVGLSISAGWRPAGGGRLPAIPAAIAADEAEFMQAMDRYRREHRRPFPTWGEVLLVLQSLGYRRVAEPVDAGTGDRAAAQGAG